MLIHEDERLLKKYQGEDTVYLTKPKPTNDINKVGGAVLFLCLK